MDINQMTCTGRLVADPESKFAGTDGQLWVMFVIANVIGSKAQYLRVKAWGEQAKFVSDNIAKGALVGIEGSSRVEPWPRKVGNEIRNQDFAYIAATRVIDLQGKRSLTPDEKSARHEAVRDFETALRGSETVVQGSRNEAQKEPQNASSPRIEEPSFC